MTALFVSDLHLHPSRPATSRCFIAFLASLKPGQTLYILGDLFESWVGDDDPEPAYTPVKQALQRCSAAGIAVFLLHGNRDFLIGERFCAQTGCTLLEDPSVVELHGQRMLLMHGDTLCTDDLEYQRMRARLRDPQWQRQALALPLPQRLQMAADARETSLASNRGKDTYLMDVNPDAVLGAFEHYRAQVMIHGHTHRPGIHRLTHNGRQLQRIVLGDWYRQGSVLRMADGRSEFVNLPFRDG